MLEKGHFNWCFQKGSWKTQPAESRACASTPMTPFTWLLDAQGLGRWEVSPGQGGCPKGCKELAAQRPRLTSCCPQNLGKEKRGLGGLPAVIPRPPLRLEVLQFTRPTGLAPYRADHVVNSQELGGSGGEGRAPLQMRGSRLYIGVCG